MVLLHFFFIGKGIKEGNTTPKPTNASQWISLAPFSRGLIPGWAIHSRVGLVGLFQPEIFCDSLLMDWISGIMDVPPSPDRK